MKLSMRWSVLALPALVLVGAAVLIGWRFNCAVALATAHAAHGGLLLPTRCGPIEYQEAGTGVPLLVEHGSGGGHAQGMAFAGTLARHGVRVVAMSRFGYLRTPMPADASVAAQADAYVCLLDALGIRRAATMMRLIGSDFLFWVALHVARDQVIKIVLATPPELLATASPKERARVNAMLDNILPVSTRAEVLRSDSSVGKRLAPSSLESVYVPTLIVSARDDGYGTYASAQYTARRMAGARFIGLNEGWHAWLGAR